LEAGCVVRANWLARLVGVLIAALVVGAAALLWFAVSASAKDVTGKPSEALVLGFWDVFYETRAPSPQVAATAIAFAVFFAVGVALLERRAANRSRRSLNPRVMPLAPKVVMAETRGVFAGEITVTVLIPAHNEEGSILATISSLVSQSRPPDRIIVVADNCTDATVSLAQSVDVEVFITIDNTKKKAGGLNQALVEILPGQGENDIVMIMDADTVLNDGFLEAAVRRFTNDRALMAIGGMFYGDEGCGLIGQIQRNEYVRYGREIGRRRGRVFVLTGTASMFRPRALREVAEQRGNTIPGQHGDVYDTVALTEDNELTIALKTLGALMISPSECRVVTELMPTMATLWRQRLRWQRGALENIGAYGITPATFRYWSQQIGIGYSVIALYAFMLMMLLTVFSVDRWIWFPFWAGLGILFVTERVVTVWKGGWRARLLAALLLPELMFDMYLNTIYVKGIIDLTLGRQPAWTHLSSVAKNSNELAA
jgi:cellulose synthase/poly-beta-1,6-N-acetylglucosamine synthase-like glycosyltransferase